MAYGLGTKDCDRYASRPQFVSIEDALRSDRAVLREDAQHFLLTTDSPPSFLDSDWQDHLSIACGRNSGRDGVIWLAPKWLVVDDG